MRCRRRLLLATIAILSFGQVFCQMVILSGPEKGSYNTFVNDIVNVLGEKNGISVKNKTTAGSGFNFKEITNPSSGYKMALIQSDYLNLMKAEDKLNNTNKAGSVKVILELAREEIQIVAKKSSGLSKMQDLSKKKVAIGNDDQGSLATAQVIKERSKIDWIPYYVGNDKMLKQLADGILDAGFIVGSAPMDLLNIDPQIMSDGISMIEMDDFNGWAKYYENDTVYRRDYKWLEKDIPTFSVRTLLVVNESKLTPAEKQTITSIRSGIIHDLDILKQKGHPKWKEVIVPDDLEVTEKSPIPVKTAAPANAVKTDQIVYRVQIFSRNYEKNDYQITVNDKNYKPYVYSHAGAFRYTIGEFPSFPQAVEFQNACRKSGYSEAFVAAFKNNVRSNDPALFK
jgi:uncharacterized protein